MTKFKPACSFIGDLITSDINDVIDKEHTLWGYIKNVREQTTLSFVSIYDGTHIKPFQLILDYDMFPYLHEYKNKLHTGAYIKVKGVIVKSPAKGQLIEMLVKEINLEGQIHDTKNYLPLVKGVSLETLRGKNTYLRPKFQTYQAVYTIVDKVDQIINNFMRKNQFKKIDPNILTLNDAESAGECFTVTTLLKDNIKNIPVNNNLVDFSKDYFGKKVHLTVSSQLQLESLVALGAGVYTINKSFRAEKSNTKKHLSEFSHFEFESRLLVTLDDLINFEEDLITEIIKKVLSKCKNELEFLNGYTSKGIIKRLEGFIQEDFGKISYTDVIAILEKDSKIIKKLFPIDKIPKWGDDLGSMCEQYIANYVFKKPVFVHSYPLELKSFYMKQNEPDEHGRLTVGAVDLLMPFIGEVIGSSLRENNHDKLVAEMDKRGMDKSQLQWYIDLRKNGGQQTAGAGVGLNRIWQLLCYMDSNIRDVTAFYSSYGEIDF